MYKRQTSNRGLAGGYNSNLIKLVTGSDFSKDDVEIYAIGGKGREVLERLSLIHISVALALIDESGCMIAAPSANTSGKPSPTEAGHVALDLDGNCLLYTSRCV